MPHSDAQAVYVNKIPQEAVVRDLLDGCRRWGVQVPPWGFVDLIDVMPRLVPEGHTADQAIVQAARVSYGAGTKTSSEDRGLIRYLVRHRHSTPLEMVEFKFHCSLPIFVARQWIRHRTANVNEYSARYSVVRDCFYRPDADEVRRQSATNRQGGDEVLTGETAAAFLEYLDRAEALHKDYVQAVDGGVSRELARIGLPLSTYTEWYWKIDLHNLFHFLSLRMDAHAQKEIRDYAQAMFELIRPIVPWACEAFQDYRLEAMTLSRLEVEALRAGQPLASDNKRENEEWAAKRKRLGL